MLHLWKSSGILSETGRKILEKAKLPEAVTFELLPFAFPGHFSMLLFFLEDVPERYREGCPLCQLYNLRNCPNGAVSIPTHCGDHFDLKSYFLVLKSKIKRKRKKKETYSIFRYKKPKLNNPDSLRV